MAAALCSAERAAWNYAQTVCVKMHSHRFCAVPREKRRWKIKAREGRFVFYFVVVVGIAAWRFIPRPWHPSLTFQTPHHTIYSTATKQQTEETAHALELLHVSYANLFKQSPDFEPVHPQLKLRLFKDRDEMRRINPGMGWAEAFYRRPYCNAYFSANETNPYHWMLHESVHQLNNEVAHLKLSKWLEEGLADYFATSRLLTNELAVGRIDPNTYPVWWMDLIATTPDLAENIQNKSVIPLRSIIENRGGPSMSGHFNLYYLHWWTLTHFIFENPRYRPCGLKLAEQGGGLLAFERTIGSVDAVETEWHRYVRTLKETLAGVDPTFLKTGKVPEPAQASTTNK
jgi:hypothetical protein